MAETTEKQTIEELKEMITTDFNTILEEEKKQRTQYVRPTTKLRKATMTKKVGMCCNYLSIHLPRDIINAMEIEKGQMIQLTIETIDKEVITLEELNNVLKEEKETNLENEEN